MEKIEDGFAERDKGSIVIPMTKAAMPNIRLNLQKAVKKAEAPFQVAKSASDEPQAIQRKAVPLSEHLSDPGKLLHKFENPEQKTQSAPPRPTFQQAFARAQNSQDEGLPEPADSIVSLNQLYKLLSNNDFTVQIGGKPYKLQLNTHEVLTLQNSNPFSSIISEGYSAVNRHNTASFSGQHSVLSPLPVKIAINVGRPSQLMTAFSPTNAFMTPAIAETSNLTSVQERKSLISVLRQLDEIPPEIAHPQPTKLIEIDTSNHSEQTNSYQPLLNPISIKLADINSANLISRLKLIDQKDQIIEPLELNMKKTKSQMGQIGRTRQELEAENELLRNQIKQNISQPVENEDNMDKELHIGFLFSSPMILRGNTSNKDMLIPALDFESESKEILAAANESKRDIRFLQAVATQVCFTEMLNRKPKALHISCHGIRNNEETIGLDYKAYRNDGDFLLLERENGEGELVSAKQLKKLIKLYSVKLDLVFVAACKSEFVGRIFQHAGANHVICVREDSEVLDKAVLVFTRKFYKNMFAGSQICEAFTKAKADVEFQYGIGQASMFKLLLAEEMKFIRSLGLEKPDPHTCYQFGPLIKVGQVQNLSDKVYVEYIYSPISNLVGRERDLVQLVSKIASGNRLTCLLGLPGIGKSSIVRNAIHFFVKRRYFLAGVVFIQAKGVDTIEVLIKQIIQKLQLRTVSEEMKQQIQERAGSHPIHLTEQIIKFVQSTQYLRNPSENSGIFNQQDRKFLLVLDNVELLIERNLNKFKDFLAILVNECMHISVVLTSRSWVVMQETIPCSTQVLLKLLPPSDIELFLESCGSQIQSQELLDFMKLHLEYPLEKLKLSRTISSWDDLEPSMQNELLLNLSNRQFQLYALSLHDFFQQLGGNPHSITLMACCRSNPTVKRSLCDLYRTIKSDQIQNLLDEEGLDLYNNELSLRISLELSIISVKENSPDAYTLYFFLGLLPGGVTESQLQILWGKTWQLCFNTLQQFGFFEQGVEKIVLKPFMINFAEEAIDRATKHQYNLMICEFYTPIMQVCYKNICRKEERHGELSQKSNGNPYLMKFLSEIRNILSCLNRLFDKETQLHQRDLVQQAQLCESPNSQVIDEHRSDLSSSSDDSSELKQDNSAYGSKKKKTSQINDSGSPIRLDQTIKSSKLKTQLMQLVFQEDQISQIDEESKSERISQSSRTSFSLEKEVNLKSNKKEAPYMSNTGISRRSHSPMQLNSNHTGTSEDLKGKKMIQTIQQAVFGRPSIRKLRGTINLGITGAKLVDQLYDSLQKTGHTVSDQRFSDKQDLSPARDSELERDQSGQLGEVEHDKDGRRFTVFDNLTNRLELVQNQPIQRRRTQVKKGNQRPSVQSEDELFANLPLQGKMQILANQSTFKMKTKKAIKISNNKRRASQLTSDSRDSILGIVEMQTAERFKVFVAASLYLSNDSSSGFEITQKALIESSKTESFIYTANMLRIHALFLEKLDQHNQIDRAPLDLKHQRNILLAIKSVRDALSKFSLPNDQEMSACVHGIALSNFHLGYLYETYAEALLLPFFVSNQGPLDFRVFSVDESRLIALEFYEKAFEGFKLLNHLAGMFTARLSARGCAFLYPEKVIKYTEDYSKYQDQFNNYVHLRDEQYCSFVPREQGETFSLLVEMANTNRTHNFFRSRPLKSHKQNSVDNTKRGEGKGTSFELRVPESPEKLQLRPSDTESCRKHPFVLKRTQIRLTDPSDQLEGPLSPRLNPFSKKLRIKIPHL